MMPARSSPRPRSSLRKRRRLPSASESSLLNLRLSLESTHQRSACTPSMSVEQIPDLMMTERKCMREAGKLSELNTLNLSGKRSTRSGARDLPEDSPSGLERDLARRRETQRPRRVVRKKRLLLLKRRNMMKRKKMRRNMMRKRNKLIFKNIVNNL